MSQPTTNRFRIAFTYLKQLCLLFLPLCLLVLASCQTVRPYERMYLNDADMALKLRQIEGYETNIHAYREGAAGANGGKAGGGCGCN
ncbi:MAG: DUF4266 domain-containing protein [Bacteroidota bacterium]